MLLWKLRISPKCELVFVHAECAKEAFRQITGSIVGKGHTHAVFNTGVNEIGQVELNAEQSDDYKYDHFVKSMIRPL